jgi:hypothetical protein
VCLVVRVGGGVSVRCREFIILNTNKYKMCREFIIMINSDVFKNLLI